MVKQPRQQTYGLANERAHFEQAKPLINLLYDARELGTGPQKEWITGITRHVIKDTQLIRAVQKLGCHYVLHLIVGVLKSQNVRDILCKMSDSNVDILQESISTAKNYDEPDLKHLDNMDTSDDKLREKFREISIAVSTYWEQASAELAKWDKEVDEYTKEKIAIQEKAEEEKLARIAKEEWAEKISQELEKEVWTIETLQEKLLAKGLPTKDIRALHNLRYRVLKKKPELRETFNSYFYTARVGENETGTTKFFFAANFDTYAKQLGPNKKRLKKSPKKKTKDGGSKKNSVSKKLTTAKTVVAGQVNIQSPLNITPPKDQLDIKALTVFLDTLQQMCDEKNEEIEQLDAKKQQLQADITNLKANINEAEKLLKIRRDAEAAVEAANAKIAQFMQLHNK